LLRCRAHQTKTAWASMKEQMPYGGLPVLRMADPEKNQQIRFIRLRQIPRLSAGSSQWLIGRSAGAS
jgi:hypothetical protein